MNVPVALYAPLKPPDDAIPSGDREMARLVQRALLQAGFRPTLASRLRSREPDGIEERQRAIALAGEEEAKRLIAHYAALPRHERPRLWVTYHCYYKAPDWIGPVVTQALDIPYCIVEASRAGKQAHGPHAFSHRGAEQAIDKAHVLFTPTAHDRHALDLYRLPHQRIVDWPPVVDLGDWPINPPRRPQTRKSGPVRLLTVAMMRQGAKEASYRLLAQALTQLTPGRWLIDIVGDGEARGKVFSAFAQAGVAVRFHGKIEDRRRLAALYGEADLFVWPAVREAFGMVFLEAQAQGCPVVAGNERGVASVVMHERTGLLTPPGDVPAFAQATQSLIDDPDRRMAFAKAARDFVLNERTLAHAARIFSQTLRPLAAGSA
jgi:glycosyltransferase involved in cell wall biosynthesis